MRALCATLETFTLIEQGIEYLLPLPVQRHSDGVVLIDPRAAHHREFVPLDRNFGGFLGDVMELPEGGEWYECSWKRLPGFRLALSALFGRRLGWGGGGG